MIELYNTTRNEDLNIHRVRNQMIPRLTDNQREKPDTISGNLSDMVHQDSTSS